MHAIDYTKTRRASDALARTSEAERNAFLDALMRAVERDAKNILAANARDVTAAKKKGLPEAFVQRLQLDEEGVRAIVAKIKSVRKLKSGLGEVIETAHPQKGLTLKKVRVPLGVLAVIYEARPEVTTDVAALCVKSGNAAILKGGSDALRTNAALYGSIRAALRNARLPEDAVVFVDTGARSATDALLQRHDAIDLVIARGGYRMVEAILEKTRIPVLAHAAGGARIYVDQSANLDMAEKILLNAKLSKPAACNSLDTVLVDERIAKKFIPRITAALRAAGVTVKRSMNWDEETLGLTVGIATVANAAAAADFANTHGKRHSEGIIAKDKRAIAAFTSAVDAAAVFVNASTRLHDGYVFGLGSEMGISTSKLHARGPVGLKELTTYKWIAYGTGNTRD